MNTSRKDNHLEWIALVTTCLTVYCMDRAVRSLGNVINIQPLYCYSHPEQRDRYKISLLSHPAMSGRSSEHAQSDPESDHRSESEGRRLVSERSHDEEFDYLPNPEIRRAASGGLDSASNFTPSGSFPVDGQGGHHSRHREGEKGMDSEQSYFDDYEHSGEQQTSGSHNTSVEGYITINQYLAVLRKKDLMPQVITLHESIEAFHEHAIFHTEADQAEKTLNVDQFQRVLQQLLSDKELASQLDSQETASVGQLGSLEAHGLGSREQLVREMTPPVSKSLQPRPPAQYSAGRPRDGSRKTTHMSPLMEQQRVPSSDSQTRPNGNKPEWAGVLASSHKGVDGAGGTTGKEGRRDTNSTLARDSVLAAEQPQVASHERIFGLQRRCEMLDACLQTWLQEEEERCGKGRRERARETWLEEKEARWCRATAGMSHLVRLVARVPSDWGLRQERAPLAARRPRARPCFRRIRQRTDEAWSQASAQGMRPRFGAWNTWRASVTPGSSRCRCYPKP